MEPVPDTGGPGDDTADTGEPPCSQNAGASSTFDLVNHHGSNVDLYWRDSSCAETLYQIATDGQTIQQPTYVGHVWTVREETTQDLVLWFAVEKAPSFTVEVE